LVRQMELATVWAKTGNRQVRKNSGMHKQNTSHRNPCFCGRGGCRNGIA
jgi:hypothetical protein